MWIEYAASQEGDVMLPYCVVDLFKEGVVELPLPKLEIAEGIKGYESQEEVNKLNVIQNKMEETTRVFSSLLKNGNYREATWKLYKEGREAIEKFGIITDSLMEFYDDMKKSLDNLSIWLQIFAYGYANYFYPWDNAFQYFGSDISPYSFVEEEIITLLNKYDRTEIDSLKTVVSPFTEVFSIITDDPEELGIRVDDFESYSELKDKRRKRLKDYIGYYPEEFYMKSLENRTRSDGDFLEIYSMIKSKNPQDASKLFYGTLFLREREKQEELWELYGHKGVSIFIARNKVTSEIAKILNSSYKEKVRGVYGKIEDREKERSADIAYDWVDILYLLQELNLLNSEKNGIPTS